MSTESSFTVILGAEFEFEGGTLLVLNNPGETSSGTIHVKNAIGFDVTATYFGASSGDGSTGYTTIKGQYRGANAPANNAPVSGELTITIPPGFPSAELDAPGLTKGAVTCKVIKEIVGNPYELSTT